MYATRGQTALNCPQECQRRSGLSIENEQQSATPAHGDVSKAAVSDDLFLIGWMLLV
jgi:hypothetical protein